MGAAAAHTVFVGGEKAEDKRADVVMAAWTAAEAALRLVKVGNTNTQVTQAIATSAKEFECAPVQGVLSHQLKKHVIDGNRVIINCVTPEQDVDEFEFEMNEVYCIDIVMSTGEGEVNRRFPALPFTLRAIEDEGVARIGVSEAKRHELLDEYPVLMEKREEFVAQFKFTVLLLPGGTKKVTGLEFGALKDQAASSKSVQDEDLRKLLATSANPKKAKKKKDAAPKAAEDA